MLIIILSIIKSALAGPNVCKNIDICVKLTPCDLFLFTLVCDNTGGVNGITPPMCAVYTTCIGKFIVNLVDKLAGTTMFKTILVQRRTNVVSTFRAEICSSSGEQIFDVYTHRSLYWLLKTSQSETRVSQTTRLRLFLIKVYYFVINYAACHVMGAVPTGRLSKKDRLL